MKIGQIMFTRLTWDIEETAGNGRVFTGRTPKGVVLATVFAPWGSLEIDLSSPKSKTPIGKYPFVSAKVKYGEDKMAVSIEAAINAAEAALRAAHGELSGE